VPLNLALRGRTYPEVRYTVDRDRVVAFAEAIGEHGPLFRDPEAAREAGYPDQVAPPTFLTVLHFLAGAQVVGDPELGLDYTRVVHGGQEYEWVRPVVVGDRLTARPRIADVYARGPHEYLVIEADITDASGERVAVARTTLISRGTAAR
jgi:acyl dehydratase